MHEVKQPKKHFFYYGGIVLLLLVLFNFLAIPQMRESQIKDVEYSTFMRATENQRIDQVDIQDNQILYTLKKGDDIYRTGKIEDPELVNRLYSSGADFTGEIQTEASPLLGILLTWVLPIIIFIFIGKYMNKKIMEKSGGANSMMFGMGKEQR